jgi:hypothetical protein
MKPRDRGKHKGRREAGTYTGIPHAVQDCANWAACSGTAIKMLCDLARQFNGSNNGNLCAALSVLRRYGWNSPDTVTWALRELQHYGLILLTRQGGRHIASLYAVTWCAIDECKGKLDCDATTVAPGDWKQPREQFKRPQKKIGTTPSVAHRYAIRSTNAQKAA